MNSVQERIVQFEKMANDDPENELGHFRLGQLYMEDGQNEKAVKSFQRTLELSPQFSKVYQLLGETLAKLERPEEAIEILTKGFAIADERGDNMPRDAISKMLVDLGQPAPQAKQAQAGGESDSGFRCVRPGCPAGRFARQLEKPPIGEELGQHIYEKVCADCWNYWLRDMSVKVINEMRLDLSLERSQEIYDQMMKETLGLE